MSPLVPVEIPDTLEVQEEALLAIAQSNIQNAMNAAGITRTELARRMGLHRSVVTKMMSGDHNMTLKTYARALWACGRRASIGWWQS